jgi:intein-encoded DNA endonuclease-like protein
LVIGDGYLKATKSHNYVIGLETTRKDYADHFTNVIQTRFTSLTVQRYQREKSRRFPNGTFTNSTSFIVTTDSKQLYLLLRPYKQRDFHWSIPEIVLQSTEAKRGFLQGIFDAEGSVDVNDATIQLISKHRQNLFQVQRLLAQFSIKSWVMQSRGRLKIYSRGGCIRFQKEIDFRYLPKKTKLAKICKIKYTRAMFEKALSLRQQGYTYRAIATKLGLKDPETVRMWVLGRKQPHSVRYGWETE